VTTGSLAAASVASGPGAAQPRSEPGWRVVARFSVAAVASAVVCFGLWSLVPRSLSGPIDVVGYPTYYNYDHNPPFWAYRLTIYAFPLLLLAFHAALGWRGPLRRHSRPGPRRSVAMRDWRPAEAPPTPGTSMFRLSVVARVALPFGVVLAAAGAKDGHVRGFALACGLAYLLVVGSAAARWGLRGLALANGVGGATAALLGLWFVSRHTAVVVAGTGHAWPWLPLWVPAVGIGLVLFWAVRRTRNGTSVRDVERLLLVVVVGSTALFLATSYLPAPVYAFRGHFDDALAMAGANLLGHGQVPWRDLVVIHGLFPDVLRGSIGRAVFDDSAWGISAAGPVLLFPLGAVFLYLLAGWVSRGNAWFLALVSLAVVGGFYPYLDGRFLLVPVALVLLGEALRRPAVGWSVGLVLVLFVQAVLVPETGFLVLPAIGCVVAADLVHRDPGRSVWNALRRTRWCAATGTVATLLFGALLAWYGALRGFVDYYVMFGPGHNESGALPIGPFAGPALDASWAAGVVVVLVTMWATVWRVRRRADWEPMDWVAVAAAAFVALYGEKALGRFDGDHIRQVFAVAVPLVVLWLWKALRWRPPVPFTSASAAVLLLAYCAVYFQPLQLTARTVERRHLVTVAADAVDPWLGYAEPNVLDDQLVADLGTALRAYAGDEPVFDMTNTPGYLYYLLNRVPGTRFPHVSLAITPYAQRLLVDELARSQPPVVVFDATHMGAPHWDGIPNTVRHYLVSEYVLDRWQPVLKTHGALLLVRRDLVARGLSTPRLAEPPATANLWFSGPGCAWGTTPSFLPTVPRGPAVELPVRPAGQRTLVDIRGWAYDDAAGRPASAVVLVAGRKVVSSVTLVPGRPEVSQVVGGYASSTGFRFSGVLPANVQPAVFALTGDGKLHPVAGPARSDLDAVEFPDGRVVPTVDSVVGSVDIYDVTQKTAGTVEVPAGLDVAGYDLATLSTGGRAFGAGQVVVTDDLGPGQRFISAVALPTTGSTLRVRVGSCLQLRGYDTGKPLYVLTGGDAPVTTVTLSGVRD
jgi:hypothetical protein